MTRSPLSALTAAALFAAIPVLATPASTKSCVQDDLTNQTEQVFFTTAERDTQKPNRDKQAERADRKKGDHKKSDRPKCKKHKKHHPLKGLDLTDAQREQAKEIFDDARKQAKALKESIKAKKEAGEEIDRKTVRAQFKAIRKEAMDNVYQNVLNDAQRAKVNERRKKMEEERAERKNKKGERPERKRKGERKGKGEKKERSTDKNLTL